MSYCVDFYNDISVRSFYRKFYSPGYEPETVNQLLSRMAKVGEIERRVVHGKAVFVISAKGERLLDEVIPLQKLGEKKWDGWWRIVIFDIEEKNKYLRDRVRKKLLELGFGKWQESVYINPHQITEELNEYFQEKDLYPRCICLEARKTGVEDNQAVAQEVFGLEILSAKYRKLLEEVNSTAELAKKQNIKNSEILNKLQSFSERFENLLLVDPYLPKELFPDYKDREKVQKAIASLSEVVAKSI